MKVKTTGLEMFARPERVVPPPREGLAVAHAKRPTVGDKACGYGPRRFWLHTGTERPPGSPPRPPPIFSRRPRAEILSPPTWASKGESC
jgi:hypothetical protein